MRGITSQRFRSPSLFLLALLLGTAGAPLSAQSGWSVGPWVGGAWHGELYHHRVDYEFAPGTVTAGGYIGNDLEELTVETGPVLGGRVNRHFAGGWTATVEAGFGSGEYVYHASGEVRSPGTEQRDWYEERWRADSRYRVLGLSAGRAVAVGAAAELSLSVAALWQRHDLTLPPPCGPSPVIEFCVSIPVEDRYDVPAGAATVGARRAIGPRLDVTADATLAFGRTDTSSFWVDYIPELDYMEGPRRHTVRTLRAGVGLAYRF